MKEVAVDAATAVCFVQVPAVSCGILLAGGVGWRAVVELVGEI